MNAHAAYLGQAEMTYFCCKEYIHIYVSLQVGKVSSKKELLIMIIS